MGCCPCLFRNEPKDINKIEDNQTQYQPTSGQFTVSKLKAATGHLSVENVLGMGGYGVVYKGTLECGQIAAIKFLFHQDGSTQTEREFKNEVEILKTLRHPNLVKLYGYASEGNENFLVYEFMPGGSLADHLEGIREKQPMDWKTRVNIALGVAKGLHYLHCTARPRVIHRDIKSSNILLDNHFQAKLGDFGLARYGPPQVLDKSHVTTRVLGSQGYCAPEYLSTGWLTFQCDIYSFGVVLLELIAGRVALDMDRPTPQHNLVNWALILFKERKWVELVDPSLKCRGDFPLHEARRFLYIAKNCLHDKPAYRPEIGIIVQALDLLTPKSQSSEELRR